MSRFKTTANARAIKNKKLMLTGIWGEAIPVVTLSRCWLIYGPEKHGKTLAALLLAKVFSGVVRTGYISGEEGFDDAFQNAMDRAGHEDGDKNMLWDDYIPITELNERLKSSKAPKVLFLDNATVYNGELSGPAFHSLMDEHPDKLFIIIAHEEDGKPYTALGKMAKRWAKVIIRMKGLTAFLSGRVKDDAVISIHPETGQLYWGMDLLSIK